MGKPTAVEVDRALAEAARLREQGEDTHCLGKTLLNHHHRLRLLEEVYRASTSYLHGESGVQHAHLVRAIEAYRRYDESPG